jgi:hypothetical protein
MTSPEADLATSGAARRDNEESSADTMRRPLQKPLLLVGLRCTARYIVLPFVLPLLGVAAGARGIVTGAALGILVMLDIAAVASIVGTLRWLWRRRHPRRWGYLPVAAALGVLIGLFLVNDVQRLTTWG